MLPGQVYDWLGSLSYKGAFPLLVYYFSSNNLVANLSLKSTLAYQEFCVKMAIHLSMIHFQQRTSVLMVLSQLTLPGGYLF